MSSVYSLRLYDTELMRFSMTKQGLAGLVAEILYVNEELAHLLPLDMGRSGKQNTAISGSTHTDANTSKHTALSTKHATPSTKYVKTESSDTSFSSIKNTQDTKYAKSESVDLTNTTSADATSTITGEDVVRWLEQRIIPKNRAFVDEILKTLGLNRNDTQSIIDVCKGLSLNDSYWVVPEGFTGKFAQYNLYENRFSNILALVAYTGASGSKQAFTTSPELTTGGMLPKAWRYVENQGIYLYKGGTSGAGNAGREPYCEYYAAQIAKTMELNAVHYELENWKGITASKCALFTNIDTAYIPIGRIVRTGGIAACLEYYKQLGTEFIEQLRSMLVFDALIYNEDRHFGNFGVLRDNRSGKLVAPAPIFDNGLSLFCYAGEEDYNQLDEYAKTRSTPYNVSFEEVCVAVMGAKQKEQLRRMIGFRFHRHENLNLPEAHLQNIEKHLEKRVRQLLDIPLRKLL